MSTSSRSTVRCASARRFGWKALAVQHAVLEFAALVEKLYPPGRDVRFRAQPDGVMQSREWFGRVSKVQYTREERPGTGIFVDVSPDDFAALPRYRKLGLVSDATVLVSFSELIED